MRKRYSAEFKSRVVLDLLQETKSIAQLASEHGVHPNLLHAWRRTALENLPQLFSADDDVGALKAHHQKEVEDLYQEIGRLSTQLWWLKKRHPT
jgi:putative transposase